MPTFSTKTLSHLTEQLAQLEQVLATEFADYTLYTLISKIPMDDWDFDGAYFTEQAAKQAQEEVLEDLRKYYRIGYAEIQASTVKEVLAKGKADKDRALRTLKEELVGLAK